MSVFPLRRHICLDTEYVYLGDTIESRKEDHKVEIAIHVRLKWSQTENNKRNH